MRKHNEKGSTLINVCVNFPPALSFTVRGSVLGLSQCVEAGGNKHTTPVPIHLVRSTTCTPLFLTTHKVLQNMTKNTTGYIRGVCDNWFNQLCVGEFMLNAFLGPALETGRKQLPVKWHTTLK